MGIVKRIKNAFNWKNGSGDDWEIINISTGEGYKTSRSMKDMSEVTYYTCMKILSESVAKLSIHLKDKDNKKVTDHDAIQLLKVRPNPFMSPVDFKKALEFSRNHYGNSYALIQHNAKGEFTGLLPLKSENTKMIIDNAKVFDFDAAFLYEYTENGKKYYFRDDEIIHLKGGLSPTGIVGKSVREELASTIAGVKESQKYLNDLYSRGLTANAVLKYTGELDETKKRTLVKTIKDFIEEPDSGNIVPLPLGMDLIPLDIKLTDAQFFELKKFTSLQIAAAFGVKPNHLNNYEKSSYANSEMQNLTFYIDTLLVILKAWEEELNYKLLTEKDRKDGLFFEFNVATILRGDLKTQAEALSKFVSGSIYKVDEAREKLGMPLLEDLLGDVILANGSYVSLEDLGIAYAERGEKNDTNKE